MKRRGKGEEGIGGGDTDSKREERGAEGARKRWGGGARSGERKKKEKEGEKEN